MSTLDSTYYYDTTQAETSQLANSSAEDASSAVLLLQETMDDGRILPAPLAKQTATKKPQPVELADTIRGLRQELDESIALHTAECNSMYDEMLSFLTESAAVSTQMAALGDLEQQEAQRLAQMEPDVDAATLRLLNQATAAATVTVTATATASGMSVGGNNNDTNTDNDNNNMDYHNNSMATA
jgi:hypothetical protein